MLPRIYCPFYLPCKLRTLFNRLIFRSYCSKKVNKLHDSPQLEGYNVTLRERLSLLGMLPLSLSDRHVSAKRSADSVVGPVNRT